MYFRTKKTLKNNYYYNFKKIHLLFLGFKREKDEFRDRILDLEF